jgi:hypothetical protein
MYAKCPEFRPTRCTLDVKVFVFFIISYMPDLSRDMVFNSSTPPAKKQYDASGNQWVINSNNDSSKFLAKKQYIASGELEDMS